MVWFTIIACVIASGTVIYAKISERNTNKAKDSNFWKGVAVLCLFAIIAVLLPKIESYMESRENSKQYMRVIVDNLEANLKNARIWGVLLDNRWPGKPIFKTLLDSETIIKYIPKSFSTEMMPLIYKLEQANSDLNRFRSPEGYGSAENIKRMRETLDSLIKDIQNILSKMEKAKININEKSLAQLSNEEVIKEYEVLFVSGTVSSDSLTAQPN